MRTILLLLIAASSAFGVLQDGVFPGTKYLSFTPAGAAWASLTSWRIEFRASGIAASGSDQGLVGNNTNVHCIIPGGSYVLRCRSYEGTSFFSDISLSGRTDIRVRFQRVPASSTMLLEIWNGDGTNYATASVAYTPAAYDGRVTNRIASFTGGSDIGTANLSFVRWYSTTLAAAQPAPPDSVVTPADLLDLEFENNTTDTSPVASAMTATGGAIAYTPTTLFPPVAVLPSATARAGSTIALDGSGSSSLTSDAPLTYFWTCTSAVTTCSFSSRAGSTTSLNTLLAGTYTVRLRVTDAEGQTNTTDTEMGAAAADSAGVVVMPSSRVDLTIGPITRSGTSPWTWFDETELGVATAILNTIGASPGDTPLVGTIALTNGSTTVTGTGTTFQSTFACNGTDLIMIHYPVVGGTGRRVQTVMSCSSQTSMVIDRGYDATAGPETGVQYGKTTNAETAKWVNQSNNWNYYDAVVAFYRAYYRTGKESYRNAARDLADKWWKWPIDGGRAWINGQGYWQQAPRMMAMIGLMLRAEDGQSGYWTGILASADAVFTQWVSNYYPSSGSGAVADVREQGYATLFQTAIASIHSDSATRAAALVKANAAFTSYWSPVQNVDGSWRFPINPALYYSGNGTLPWQAGFTTTYLTNLHRLGGSSSVLASIKLAGDFMTSYGIDPLNDGGYYDVYYTRCPAYDKEKTGTATVTNGSASVTGSGTLFQTQFACNGTDRIAFDLASGTRVAYVVQSCSSETAMTLSTTFAEANESGVRILKFPLTGPIDGCGTCAWGTCGSYGASPPSAVSDARTLLNASHSIFGYLYATGQGSGYRTTGDEIFAQNLGLGGPGNDGNAGHYNDVIASGSAPSYAADTFLSKEFAFVGGASGAHSYLAWRDGIPAPESLVSVSVGVKIAAVPNATKVRITLTRPNGETSTTTCASSPCVVTADSRQGARSSIVIEYLSASDAVLSTGQPQGVPI